MGEKMGVQRILTAGMLQLDLDQKVLKINNVKVKCFPKDFELLQFFIEQQGRVVTAEMISDHLYKNKNLDPAQRKTVIKHISRLRKMLLENGINDAIETIPQGGYRLKL